MNKGLMESLGHWFVWAAFWVSAFGGWRYSSRIDECLFRKELGSKVLFKKVLWAETRLVENNSVMKLRHLACELALAPIDVPLLLQHQ
jgi:hypothetical protein